MGEFIIAVITVSALLAVCEIINRTTGAFTIMDDALGVTISAIRRKNK